MSARRRNAIVWVLLVATMAILGGLTYEYRADLFPDMTVNKLVVNSTTDLETLTSCIRLPTDGDGTVSCGTTYTWSDLDSYPAACAASNWVTAVGDTLTCAQPSEADISDLAHTTPGGVNHDVQFNNAGAFGGETAFSYDDATNILTVQVCNLGTAANDTEDYIKTADGFYELEFTQYIATENRYAVYPGRFWTDSNDNGTADDLELTIDSDDVTVGTPGDDDTTFAIFGSFNATCSAGSCIYQGPVQLDGDGGVNAVADSGAGSGQVTCDVCNIDTVASGHVVTLKNCQTAGALNYIANSGANTLKVYADATDTYAGGGTSVNITTTQAMMCFCLTAAVQSCHIVTEQ